MISGELLDGDDPDQVARAAVGLAEADPRPIRKAALLAPAALDDDLIDAAFLHRLRRGVRPERILHRGGHGGPLDPGHARAEIDRAADEPQPSASDRGDR